MGCAILGRHHSGRAEPDILGGLCHTFCVNVRYGRLEEY